MGHRKNDKYIGGEIQTCGHKLQCPLMDRQCSLQGLTERNVKAAYMATCWVDA